MPDLHLISHHLCPYVQRAAIVLSEKDIAHRRTYIDLANKPYWFAALSPLGKVPVLQVGDTALFESQVIAEYLDEITPGSLHPADPLAKARHRAWIEFASQTLNGIGRFYNAPDRAAFDDEGEALRRKFERLEPLIVGPFFEGARFYLVDGVWGTVFRYFDVFDDIADFGILAGLDRIARWRAELARRPSVVTAVPAGYAARLRQFLLDRRSHISTLMREAA